MPKRFVSYAKLSKRAKKELNAKQRTLWMRSPVTRITPDKTKYNRNQEKANARRDYDEV